MEFSLPHRLRFVFSLLAFGVLSGCTTNIPVSSMPQERREELRSLVLENQSKEVLPDGWRELSGDEIREKMAGKDFAGHQVQMKRNRRFIYEIENDGTMHRGLGQYTRNQCKWFTDEYSITFDCPDINHRWFVFSDGSDMVMMRLYQGRRYFNIVEEINFRQE